MDKIFDTARARAEANEEIADSQRRADRRRGYDKAQYNRLSRRLARTGLRGFLALGLTTVVVGASIWAADKETTQSEHDSETTVDLIQKKRDENNTTSKIDAFGDNSDNTLAGPGQ